MENVSGSAILNTNATLSLEQGAGVSNNDPKVPNEQRKPKRILTPEQKEQLARAREKAFAVRRAKKLESEFTFHTPPPIVETAHTPVIKPPAPTNVSDDESRQDEVVDKQQTINKTNNEQGTTESLPPQEPPPAPSSPRKDVENNIIIKPKNSKNPTAGTTVKNNGRNKKRKVPNNSEQDGTTPIVQPVIEQQGPQEPQDISTNSTNKRTRVEIWKEEAVAPPIVDTPPVREDIGKEAPIIDKMNKDLEMDALFQQRPSTSISRVARSTPKPFPVARNSSTTFGGSVAPSGSTTMEELRRLFG
jgi:hypothetical protein